MGKVVTVTFTKGTFFSVMGHGFSKRDDGNFHKFYFPMESPWIVNDLERDLEVRSERKCFVCFLGTFQWWPLSELNPNGSPPLLLNHHYANQVSTLQSTNAYLERRVAKLKGRAVRAGMEAIHGRAKAKKWKRRYKAVRDRGCDAATWHKADDG